MAYRGKKVSIVITSCKRLHLLRRTLYALSVCCDLVSIVLSQSLRTIGMPWY